MLWVHLSWFRHIAELVANLRNQSGDICDPGSYLAPQQVGLGLLHVGSEETGPRPIRRRSLSVVTPTPKQPESLCLGVPGQLLSGTGLAEPGSPDSNATWPRPSLASASAARRRSISLERPTKPRSSGPAGGAGFCWDSLNPLCLPHPDCCIGILSDLPGEMLRFQITWMPTCRARSGKLSAIMSCCGLGSGSGGPAAPHSSGRRTNAVLNPAFLAASRSKL